MYKQLITAALSAALLLPASAEAFTTARGVKVNPVDDIVFEVIPKSSGSVSDFWCGASEYARRVKGAGWRDLIYVVRGRGASVTTGRKSAAQFTLSPDAAGVGPAPQGWLTLGIKSGDRMSVQQARGYCNESPVRSSL